MFSLFKKGRARFYNVAENAQSTLEGCVLTSSLEKNVQIIRDIFVDVDILRVKHIENAHFKSLCYCILFFDGVVDAEAINGNIVKPLQLSQVAAGGKGMIDVIMNQIVQISEASKTNQLQKIVEAVCYGETILLVDGQDQAVLLNAKEFKIRSVSEPDNEKIMAGPRDGFTESLMTNLSFIRRRALTPDLKMKFLSLGRRTKTKACICYMEGIVNKQILEELYHRLNTIDIDGVLDVNYITELIKDAPWSPFRSTGYTERPDVIMGKILEGRIAVFLDGTPMVMTVPYLFVENFQSSEDYYLSFFYSSFSRLLRILSFFLTIIVPGLYISIGAFHHEMFPLQLFINIAAERQSVPLPAAVEAFGMLILFDILKETGARMPSTIGQTLIGGHLCG
ncbi:MAG: spore germination protein [Candidatus Pelethousia sp.]|nr:spore germination protein [Candidatus Pelethousia sp.]